jgi:hypothetical protein
MGGKKFSIRMSWRENLFTFLYANLSAYLDPYKSLIFRPLWSQSKLKAPFRIGLGLFFD